MQQGTDTWTVRWPADRVEKLKELWPIMTASQIGRCFGLTRSAIIGKVYRLGLPLKKLDRLLLPKRGGSPVNARSKPVYVPKRHVSAAPLVPEAALSDMAEPKFLNRTLSELSAGECRYPRGDRAPYRFCGNAACDASSYCAYHTRLCVRATAPMRREFMDWSAR